MDNSLNSLRRSRLYDDLSKCDSSKSREDILVAKVLELQDCLAELQECYFELLLSVKKMKSCVPTPF